MTPREAAEYRALRATIREWAALQLASGVLVAPLISSLLPLLVLAITFEVAAYLYTAVERVGRYLQVFFEQDVPQGPGGGWEQRVMEYGARFPGSGSDPLFGVYLFTCSSSST
jgi:hypothetical protein